MKSVRLTAALVLFVSSAFAQSMTSISPNYGPGNSTVTITGTGFSMTPKSTRFVDNGNMDIFYPISCTSTTTCFGTPRTGLVTSGSQNLAVFALVDGSKSGSFASFRYYAPPVVSSLVPATVPFNTGGQTVNVNGGIFTSGVSFPGTTSIYMYTSTNDYTNGCGSTALCSFFAPAICGDFSQGGGAMLVAVSTPGGTTNPYFIYGTAPPTPTITSISPSTGPSGGGNTVTITGTNFRTGTTATVFTFTNTPGGSSGNPSVNCTTTTSCTAVVPAGSSAFGGVVDVTVAVAGALVATGCSTGPANRSPASIPTTKLAAYRYAGIMTAPNAITTTENGGTAQLAVSLNTQPTANVHVAITADATRATLSATAFDFTNANWNVPQILTVTGRDDTGVGGAAMPGTFNAPYSVGFSATSTDTSYNFASTSVSATNLDNDTGQFAITPITTGLTTSEPSGTATVSIVLTKAPTGTVQMSLTSNDPTEGTVSPTSLTFATTSGGATGWNVPRTVTITGVDDATIDGNIPYTIILQTVTSDPAYQNPTDLQVTNLDNDPAGATRGDFNGDGTSDIMWRGNSDGVALQWFMNGATVTGVNSFGPIALSTNIEGIGDFNADGRADLIWRNPTTGDVTIWLLNAAGTGVQSAVNVGSVNTDYKIEQVADYNGDGKADVIWRGQTSGGVIVWIMNGATVQSVISLGSVNNTYKIEAAGDLNGDGKADLVWRGQLDGNVVVWLTNASGTNTASSTLVSSVNTTYQIVSAADMTGDGRADIIWRGTTDGNVVIWTMSGFTVTTVTVLANVATTAKIESVGDVNGDGRADLIWRGQSDGNVIVFLTATGSLSVQSATVVGNVNTTYSIQGPK